MEQAQEARHRAQEAVWAHPDGAPVMVMVLVSAQADHVIEN
jgi:hypothetical protein